MTARCHAGSCDDPLGGPEPTADLGGMTAHETCAEWEQHLSDTAAARLLAHDPAAAVRLLDQRSDRG